MPSQPFAGVLVPVLTPFTLAGEPDAGRLTMVWRVTRVNWTCGG